MSIWKPIILLFGSFIILVLAIIWIALMISFFYAFPFANYFFVGSQFASFLGFINSFFVVGIPALFVVLFCYRLVYGNRLSPRWQAGIWSFWTVNLISLIIIGVNLVQQFNHGSEYTTKIDLLDLKTDTLNLSMGNSPHGELSTTIGNLQISEEFLLSNEISLSIIKSDNAAFELEKVIKSRGASTIEANTLVEKIAYDVQVTDETLELLPDFMIQQGHKWRGQEVELILKVPEGKAIKINDRVARFLGHLDIDRTINHPWVRNGQIWRMESNGLVCPEWMDKTKKDANLSFQDFDQLNIEGFVKVTIEEGAVFKVQLQGKEIYTRNVDLKQTGNILRVATDLKESSAPVRLYITMPSLTALTCRNTEDIKLRGFKAKELTIKNEGRGDIKAYVDIEELTVTLDGRNELDLRGSGKKLDVILDERATLAAEHYAVDNAFIRAASHSRAKVAVKDTLQQQLDQSCRIRVDGDPVVIER
ncbi:MAG: DUF2807 domain-containing protein [Saprospiraceae bacterium]